MSDHHHDHAHADGFHLSGRKIFWVTVLNATITAAEVVGGLLSGSLALLSDAVHNMSDTFAIALSYVANRMSNRPKDAKRTYGYKRAEILSAFVNASVLLAITVFLVIEAVQRFRSPQSIDGTLMLVVAAIGLAANVFSVFLLERDSHENLNIKSSYLHLLGDTVSSVGVLAGGLVIRLWGQVWVDPVVTILIALYIAKETSSIVQKTVGILMQSSAPLDYEVIKADIEAMDKVKNIHHVHSWMANEKTIHFEAHLDLEDMLLSEVQTVYEEIEEYLVHHHQVSHVTLQAEVDRCCDKEIFKL
ncbi:MAG: cation diffusion facilitator family transporter [Sphaerochaeta sp.]|nr:cation diffusion facilitator family transporter [Sphaerochaeta sp.]